MIKLMVTFWTVMGVGTYILFNGLVNGMPGLDVAATRIFTGG